jgi:hypothetical protein
MPHRPRNNVMAYATAYGNSGGSSVKTCLALVAAASSMRRARLLEIELGNASSPADNAFIFIIQRATTAGTGTTVTPNMTDAGDTLASTIVATQLITADPTLTAGTFAVNWAVNQRGSVRWVSAPGAELVIPATASNGYGIGVSAASTTTQACSCTFLEL